MVYSSACCTKYEKIITTRLKSLLYGKHKVGIVLFRGEDLDIIKNRLFSGIKVTHNNVRLYAHCLCKLIALVSGYHKRIVDKTLVFCHTLSRHRFTA